MSHYYKLVFKKNISTAVYPTIFYYSTSGFKLYDEKSLLISGLNNSNIVRHTYVARALSTDLDKLFSPVTDNTTPYASSLSGMAEIVLKLNSKLSRIEILSYGNEAGAGSYEIFHSEDNVNYIYVSNGDIVKPNTWYHAEIMHSKLLLKSNNKIYSLKSNENLTQLPSDSTDNFINYGSPSIDDFNLINDRKNYILQDGVSETTDGLWVQELDRKPLSIKFEVNS